jgi:hypothetical protein
MIISVSGKIGSGKDTVASIIMELADDKPWEVKKWAGKLKEVATLLTGIPKEKFEDQEFKKTNLGPEWNIPVYHGGEFISSEPMTVRDLLQLLGTEAMRNGLHTDTWVNALMSEYKTSNGVATQEDGEEKGVVADKFWIITDTRFPNELAAVARHKGITIKVVRDSGNQIGTTHSSETALDHVDNWDYVIYNHGTIDELRKAIFNILRKERIIRISTLK